MLSEVIRPKILAWTLNNISWRRNHVPRYLYLTSYTYLDLAVQIAMVRTKTTNSKAEAGHMKFKMGCILRTQSLRVFGITSYWQCKRSSTYPLLGIPREILMRVQSVRGQPNPRGEHSKGKQLHPKSRWLLVGKNRQMRAIPALLVHGMLQRMCCRKGRFYMVVW